MGLHRLQISRKAKEFGSFSITKTKIDKADATKSFSKTAKAMDQVVQKAVRACSRM